MPAPGPIHDMGHKQMGGETKRRTKRDPLGIEPVTYFYNPAWRDAGVVERLLHLIAERYEFVAELRSGYNGPPLLTSRGRGDGSITKGDQ